MTTPRHILKTVFGYDSFRLNQESIIQNVLAGHDTLAVMPTGGGKSMCYQIPALLFPGLTIVVSPLISLMHDQIEQLQEAEINAVVLNSAIDSDTYRSNMSRVARGEVKMLYMAPETMLLPRILDFLSSVKVSCLTIDEAHCISEWGHEFRPEYRQLALARERFPEAVCIALTATATPQVRDDIRRILQFESTNEFISSFDRPNLHLEVCMRQDGLAQVLDVVERFSDGAGIVYCASRKQVEQLTGRLRAKGVSALAYHAGLDDDTRAKNQEAFRLDDVRVIVATVAFGMGINKPDVRFVVHYELPKNIESYYQQIGRAGRDGLDAYCLLLFSYADIAKIGFFIEQMSQTEQRQAAQHLQTLIRYCESAECRRGPLLAYFGETHQSDSCGYCDNCERKQLPEIDLTKAAQKFMSCVYRTGQRFGASHVADVLRGSKAQKVLDLNHDTLSTYGIGADTPKAEWLFVANMLLQYKLIVQNEHGGLVLTEEAIPVLKNEQRFRCRVSAIAQKSRSRTAAAKKSNSKKSAVDHTLHNPDLFEKLRTLRTALARKKRVPPYVIFSDKTLIAMANDVPKTDSALLDIPGVGEAKLKKYGPAFLEILKIE
ncbi:MAG: DNA helicase RecQ [Deltaproteobacteria bacterium]|nr:DNA helicase RecQ [Deltaproteobacteria bacterium]MBN2671027.1 DNA helicase RecQ [Deltaproteobacteria bacterium]